MPEIRGQHHVGSYNKVASSSQVHRENQSEGLLRTQLAWVPSAHGSWAALQLPGHIACGGASELQGVLLLKGALWSEFATILGSVAKQPAWPGV